MTYQPANLKTPVKMNSSALGMIEDINARQDDALRQLDELNEQIEALVELCVKTARVEAGENEKDAATVEQSAIEELEAPMKRAA